MHVEYPPRHGTLEEVCAITEARLTATLPKDWAVEMDPVKRIATILAPDGRLLRLKIIWRRTVTPREAKILAYDLEHGNL
jgi:hypothetical protein